MIYTLKRYNKEKKSRLFYMYKKLLLLSLLFSLSACESKDDKLEKLLKITKENMVFVKGGTFMMGDPQGTNIKDKYGYNILRTPENEKKYPDAQWMRIGGGVDLALKHKVTLSDYSISKYETTWEEFDLYYEIIGKEYYKKESKDKNREFRSSKMPATTPTWYEAKNYCKFLAKKTGLNYDLPTEAQWEYAARSRGEYVYFATDTGRGVENRDSLNPTNEPKNIGDGQFIVGSFPPNPLGLYDMSGNRHEWVNDWYSEDYYTVSPEFNPIGPIDGTEKVIRGGKSSLTFARGKREITSYSIGFRCVLNP